MLNPKKEFVDANRGHGISEQVDLKCETSRKGKDDTFIQPVEEDVQYLSKEEDVP